MRRLRRSHAKVLLLLQVAAIIDSRMYKSRFLLCTLVLFQSTFSPSTADKSVMPNQQKGKKLADEPIHLGLDATSHSLTKITGMEWYEQYAKNTASDGNEGRLVSIYIFSKSWDVWEMHPVGEEVVFCTAGSVTLVQDAQGDESSTTEIKLDAGEYAINPKGVWHTANVEEECTVLFITPGIGTQHKKRMMNEEL